MAKQEELKKKIWKILLVPKEVTRVLTFQNNHQHQAVHKYHKHHHDGPKGSSSIMMIPEEARRRRRSKLNGSTKSLEPTSPTVSCIGQIKQNKKKHQQLIIKKAKSKRITTTLPTRPLLRNNVSEVRKNNKQTSTFQRIFRRRGRESSRGSTAAHGGEAVAAPELRQMKRFESRRGALADFDWKKAHLVGPEDDDDDENIMSFSEPIIILKPKPEINLWKKRNVPPPPPLRSNPRFH